MKKETIKKQEVIRTVAKNTKNNIKAVEIVVNNTFDVITDFMVKGNRVSISGFGFFDTNKGNIRDKDNNIIEGSVRYSPTFRAGNTLKRRIKERK